MNKFLKRGTAYVNFDKHCLWCKNFRVSNVLMEACCDVRVGDGYGTGGFYNTDRDDECIYPDKFERSKYKKRMSKVLYSRDWETGEIHLIAEEYKKCEICRRPIVGEPYTSGTNYGWGWWICSEECYLETKKEADMKVLKDTEYLSKIELRELIVKFHPDRNKDLYLRHPAALVDYKNVMNKYNERK